MTTNNTMHQQEILIQMVLDAWHAKTGELDQLLAGLSPGQLQKEASPGRNRGLYIVGHLTALADSILPLLGEEKCAPHLFKPFVQTPDKENAVLPEATALQQDWTNVKTRLEDVFAGIAPDEWFRKHTAISDDDFAKEPHRNKLNVVLSRVGHMGHHIGQVTFLKTNA
jgi:hypothetical protein